MGFLRNFFNKPPEDDDDSDESMEPDTVDNEQMNDPVDDTQIDTNPMMDEYPSSGLSETVELQPVMDDNMNDHDDDFVEVPQAGTVPLSEFPEDDRMEPPGATRQLPQESMLMAQPQGHLTVGIASDTGMVRNNNQDAVLSFFFSGDSADELPDFGTFVVADGMGGHKEGEKASALTARSILNDIFTSIYAPMLNDEAMDSGRLTITEALVQSIEKANMMVRKRVQDGGTTVTSVVVVGDQAYFGHVGDSRAYLIRQDGSIEQITRDHSVVQRLIELDQLTPEEAETHEQRNVLYRAVGQNEEVEVDILRRRLQANTCILLCSDGLWGMVDDETMVNLILSTDDPQEACQKLVAKANANGGTDNITALLLKVPSS